MRDELEIVKIGENRYELYRNLSLPGKVKHNIIKIHRKLLPAPKGAGLTEFSFDSGFLGYQRRCRIRLLKQEVLAPSLCIKPWYNKKRPLEKILLTGFIVTSLSLGGSYALRYYDSHKENLQNENKTEQSAQNDNSKDNDKKQPRAMNVSSIDELADAGLREKAEGWLEYYTTDNWGRKVVQIGIDNNSIYVGLVEGYVQSKNLPEEYVNWIRAQEIVESISRSDAKSPANARGLHQIVRKTGKALGLKSNRIINEAGDPVKGTQKGIDYLMELVDRFGIMYGFVAYNAGPARVAEAINSTNSHDYNAAVGYIKKKLELKKKRLKVDGKKGYINPDEPVNYLPKIAAIREILIHPDMYGFNMPEEKNFIEEYMRIAVGKNCFGGIAKKHDISVKELHKINGHINDTERVTPNTHVYVPRGR